MSPRARLSPNAVTTKISASLAALPASDARVARAILADPDAVLAMAVADLATVAGTAPSTVIHACKQMGFAGFQDLKIGLARESGGRGSLRHVDLPEDAAPGDIKNAVMTLSAQAIVDVTTTLSDEAFARACALLSAAHRILIVGLGTSHAPAVDAAHRFRLLGRRADALVDPIGLAIAAGQLEPGDVCLTISHTGATEPTLTCAQHALDAGASVIAITSYRRSPLTQIANAVLVAGAPERSFRLEAMTSRLAHLAVIDALYVAVALSDPTRAERALEGAAAITGRYAR